MVIIPSFSKRKENLWNRFSFSLQFIKKVQLVLRVIQYTLQSTHPPIAARRHMQQGHQHQHHPFQEYFKQATHTHAPKLLVKSSKNKNEKKTKYNTNTFGAAWSLIIKSKC